MNQIHSLIQNDDCDFTLLVHLKIILSPSQWMTRRFREVRFRGDLFDPILGVFKFLEAQQEKERERAKALTNK
jgi:hypothetical protein